nr:Calx-beta domain-containing protein [Pyrinomonadaceae bacterium]
MKNVLRSLFFAVLFLVSFASVNAATYVVDRLDDVAGATACTAAANDCSLRGAIINANANGAGADVIQFNVGGGNLQTISISATALPDIQTSLTIDGTTQPGWISAPIIEINGTNASSFASGFIISSPVSGVSITVAVKGLIINRFHNHGISFEADSPITATVSGCYIGTGANGSADLGNGIGGISIQAHANSTFNIGGFSSSSERNVISGNGGSGIQIFTYQQGFVTGNTAINVFNNLIGTNSAGNADLGNSFDGISFSVFNGDGSEYTLNVGTGTASGRNIISGNQSDGIRASAGNVNVYGNYIGTNINGTADLGNSNDGIELNGIVNSAFIGGTLLGFNAGNLISGNGGKGVSVKDANIPAAIRRNQIGTNAAGSSAIPNATGGISLTEADTDANSPIVIGSSVNADDGNTISGNGGDGIEVGVHVNKVKIYGNKVGTNILASSAIPNSLSGINLSSSQNEVGLADNNIASNIVSGNAGNGIKLLGTSNEVQNNYIGTNSGGADIGNVLNGLHVGSGSNRIGNATTGGSNKIAFNHQNGVMVIAGFDQSIRVNSIYSNGGLGIDLNNDGVTPNDNGDGDSGPNKLQNFPVLQLATPSRILGFLNVGQTLTPYRIEFYRVDSCDASGYGEGRYFLGSQTVASNPIDTNIDFEFPTSLTVGQFVTATATLEQDRDTSEFSQCVAVTGEPGNLTFSAAAYSAVESAGSRTIVVNRVGGSSGTISVNYTTENGTATAGQDYTTQSGTFTFLNGEVVKSFNIPINYDLYDENNETIDLKLSNPSLGVSLTPNQSSTLTILDDDVPPTISIEDVSHLEGNLEGTTQFSFRIQLSAPSELPISVDFSTANGTANGGVDFLHTNGTVNFGTYETLKNILVTVNGDTTPELDETFFVNLTNPQNAAFGDNQALGTILDDDNAGKFSFAFAPYSGTEHDLVTVTVSRTNGTAGTVSVDYAT